MAFRAALLASALLLGAMCVHAWQVLGAPRAAVGVSQPLRGPEGTVADPASLHIFGSPTGPVVDAPVGPPANLTLTGVISARQGRPAAALVTVDGKPQAFLPGDTVTGPWQLSDIQSDHIVLEQNGQHSELALTESHAAPPGKPVMPAPAPGNRGVPPGLAPGFKLDVQSLGPNHLSFSKADLSRGLQDPHVGNAMGRASAAAGGGLTLDEVAPGTLADRLGLRTGDVLHSANGQPLNTLTDLPRLYQEFGSAAAVRLELTRDGQPTILQYTVRP